MRLFTARLSFSPCFSSCGTRPAFPLAALGLAFLTPAAHAQTQSLYVTNYDSGAVSRYAGTASGTFSTNPMPIASGLSNPTDLIFDTRGDLFVSNTGSNTVLEYTAGIAPGAFNAPTALSGGSLAFPEGLAFDTRGDLFVANYTGNGQQGSISEFTAGLTPGTFGTGQVIETGVGDPEGLAIDARGDLFAVNEYNNTITEYAAGTAPGIFGIAMTFTDPSLNSPRGLTVDANGDLFAANQLGNTITEFTAGTAPGTFSGAKTLMAASLNAPQGLAFDSRGNLFATNAFGNSITEFAASLVPGTFGPGQVVETNVPGANGLAFGPAAVPEASTTVSFGLLLAFGMGGMVVAARKKKAAA